MFSTTKLRFSVISASLFLRTASWPTDPARTKRITSSASVMSKDVAIEGMSSYPHVNVFRTLKGSLDNIFPGTVEQNVSMSITAEDDTHDEGGISLPDSEQLHKEGDIFTDDALPEEEGAETSDKMVLPFFYKPMSIRGTLYEGELADRLCAEAASRRFRSPVWATRVVLERAGYTVGNDEEGTDIITSIQKVTLYNLEQTNASEATISSLLKDATNTPRPWLNFPLAATGRPHTRRMRRIIWEHPSYSHYTSPFWITEEEAVALGTEVKPSQKGCGIIITRRLSEATTPLSGEESGRPSASDSLSQLPTDFFMLYNAAQLEKPENVTRETCPPIECINVNGDRYSSLLTVHMRKYSQKYQFSIQPVATFITAARLNTLGGHLRAMDKVVPSFTCVINDEVVSLYHAEHTTISEKLVQQAMTRRRERFDRIVAKVV